MIDHEATDENGAIRRVTQASLDIPELSTEVLSVLREWHDSLIAVGECVAAGEGQFCCLDMFFPEYEAYIRGKQTS